VALATDERPPLSPRCTEMGDEWMLEWAGGSRRQVALWSPRPLDGTVALVITPPAGGEGLVSDLGAAMISDLPEVVTATLLEPEEPKQWTCCGGNGLVLSIGTSGGTRMSPVHRPAPEWQGADLPDLAVRYPVDGNAPERWVEAVPLGGLVIHERVYVLWGDGQRRPRGWEQVDRLSAGQSPRLVATYDEEVQCKGNGRRRVFDAPMQLEWVEAALRAGMAEGREL
jgi:hypothetical protein